jgi:hypothetical protein
VQYTLPVDEDNLPKCPDTFPHQFLFYAGTQGEIECSACECSEPVGAKCEAAISAYQDPACGSFPKPLFENVPADQGLCIDFAGSPYALGATEAQWIENHPGTCEASGGELIGAKAVDPRVFCCQEPPLSLPPQN